MTGERRNGHTAVPRAPSDPGLQLLVAGGVYNTRGEPLPMAKVDVWQADHLGHYDMTGYRYRALLRSGAKGEYDFHSVLPGH